jgi:hypothetical protein
MIPPYLDGPALTWPNVDCSANKNIAESASQAGRSPLHLPPGATGPEGRELGFVPRRHNGRLAADSSVAKGRQDDPNRVGR